LEIVIVGEAKMLEAGTGMFVCGWLGLPNQPSS